MVTKTPTWEKTLDRIGMAWTGSLSDRIAVQEAICMMCDQYNVPEDRLVKARLEGDVRQEMAIGMLRRLEKFDPSRPSDHDKSGKETPNALKKYILSCAKLEMLTAKEKVARQYNINLSDKPSEITFIDLDGSASHDDDTRTLNSELYADPRAIGTDRAAMSSEGMSAVLEKLSAVAAVVIRFKNDQDSRHKVIRRFTPICYSEHLTYVLRCDRGRDLLKSKLLSRYKKDILYTLEWDYLRRISEDLQPVPSLEALYGTELKLESELLPNGRNVRLQFIGEMAMAENGEHASAGSTGDDKEPAASKMAFFLKNRLVSLDYYNETYQTNSTPTLVRQERIHYVNNIMALLN